MKNLLFFLALFASSLLKMQACESYGGMNQLQELVAFVTDSKGQDLPSLRSTNCIQESTDWQSDGGVGWLNLGSAGLKLNYWDDDYSYYYMIHNIEWSNRGYIQKDGSSVVWIQPDIYDPLMLAGSDDGKIAVFHNDLEFLDSLNFSGNRFYHFELDGTGIMPIEHINFSNNPTLDTLVVRNCPKLVDVDITNSNLRLSKIYALTQTVESGELKYAPQGTVLLTYPVDAVNLSADVDLDGTVSTIIWDTQPVYENDGVFTFDASLVGKTVTATLFNSKLKEFDNGGLKYEIKLTESVTGIPTLSTNGERIYSTNGQLFIESKFNEAVNIYLIDGRLIKKLSLVPGTTNVALPSNIYIVHFADGLAQKVIVK